MEIGELVTPLRKNSERVLEERNDDQEASNGREVPAQNGDMVNRSSSTGGPRISIQFRMFYSRLDGFAEAV